MRVKRTRPASERRTFPFVKLQAIAFLLALAAPANELKKGETLGGFGDAQYRLGPEDVIEVFVWKEQELSTTVVVRPDGRISLPLANDIEARGKTAAQLQAEISERLRKYVADPTVNVIVKEVNSPKVSVLGEVRRPDLYKMRQRITVLDAIAMAGGFTEFAKRDRVVVLRNGSGGQQRIRLNVKQVVTDGGGEVFYLQPLDTVYVE